MTVTQSQAKPSCQSHIYITLHDRMMSLSANSLTFTTLRLQFSSDWRVTKFCKHKSWPELVNNLIIARRQRKAIYSNSDVIMDFQGKNVFKVYLTWQRRIEAVLRCRLNVLKGLQVYTNCWINHSLREGSKQVLQSQVLRGLYQL